MSAYSFDIADSPTPTLIPTSPQRAAVNAKTHACAHQRREMLARFLPNLLTATDVSNNSNRACGDARKHSEPTELNEKLVDAAAMHLCAILPDDTAHCVIAGHVWRCLPIGIVSLLDANGDCRRYVKFAQFIDVAPPDANRRALFHSPNGLLDEAIWWHVSGVETYEFTAHMATVAQLTSHGCAVALLVEVHHMIDRAIQYYALRCGRAPSLAETGGLWYDDDSVGFLFLEYLFLVRTGQFMPHLVAVVDALALKFVGPLDGVMSPFAASCTAPADVEAQ